MASLFRVCAGILAGFARFILFFASIIVLVSSSALLLSANHARGDFGSLQLAPIDTALTVVVGFSAYLIALAIMGIFASFSSSRSTIKMLALMTTLNVVIGIAVLASASPKSDRIESELVAKLEDSQAQYDWDHAAQKSETVRLATLAWDTIQSDLKCCGMDSPRDWDALKPEGHEKQNILPASCCQDFHMQASYANRAPGYCEPDKSPSWTAGCSHKMEATLSTILVMVIFMICFSLVVSVLAGIVLCCKPERSYYQREATYY